MKQKSTGSLDSQPDSRMTRLRRRRANRQSLSSPDYHYVDPQTGVTVSAKSTYARTLQSIAKISRDAQRQLRNLSQTDPYSHSQVFDNVNLYIIRKSHAVLENATNPNEVIWAVKQLHLNLNGKIEQLKIDHYCDLALKKAATAGTNEVKKGRVVQAIHALAHDAKQQIGAAKTLPISRATYLEFFRKINDTYHVDPTKRIALASLDKMKLAVQKIIDQNQLLDPRFKHWSTERLQRLFDTASQKVGLTSDDTVSHLVLDYEHQIDQLINQIFVNRFQVIVRERCRQIKRMRSLGRDKLKNVLAQLKKTNHHQSRRIENAKGYDQVVDVEKQAERAVNQIFNRLINANSFKIAAFGMLKKSYRKTRWTLRERTGNRIQRLREFGAVDPKRQVKEITAKQKQAEQRVDREYQKANDQIRRTDRIQLVYKIENHAINNFDQLVKIKHRPQQAPQQRLPSLSLLIKRNHYHFTPYARKHHVPVHTGNAAGFYDGTYNRRRRMQVKSADFWKFYGSAYRDEHRYYKRSFAAGYRDGRTQRLLGLPPVNLSGLLYGYVKGYQLAYRRYRVHFPFYVYAKRTIYSHRTPRIERANRLVRYPKRLHHYNQRLKVLDVVVNGELTCYRIATGYIPADPDFVTLTCYRSNPHRVKVVSPGGINYYGDPSLSHEQVKGRIRPGEVLSVKRLHLVGNDTSLELRDGTFVTGDKNRVKQIEK